MSTVRNILDALFTLAPENLREDWDNVGLLCGHPEREVKHILVALDASDAALREAVQKDCQLLVAHHPVIFSGIRKLTPESAPGKRVLYAAEHGIACIGLHTNLDSAPGGVDDLLAEALGLTDTQTHGYLRIGNVSKQSLAAFASFVKETLSCPGLRYVCGGRAVHRVAVGCGACGDETEAAIAAGCDTFVTSDVTYHTFCDAAEMGLNLIDAGHFETENPVCGLLVSFLRERFPETETFLSREHGDVIRFL